jgi:hypothetical protein
MALSEQVENKLDLPMCSTINKSGKFALRCMLKKTFFSLVSSHYSVVIFPSTDGARQSPLTYKILCTRTVILIFHGQSTMHSLWKMCWHDELLDSRQVGLEGTEAYKRIHHPLAI